MDIKSIYSLFIQCDGVSTDSRKCPKDFMFIALKGDNFDGNVFVDNAIESGCKFALTSDEQRANNKTIFYVPDTLVALQQLASYHRQQMNATVIAITGTNGKTTTKELTSAVMKAKYGDDVINTEGNLNNHIGVPLTLLRIKAHHKYAIVEMGANHPGEIKTLADIALPDYGLITNVGTAHILGFGSFEGVIKTKCELYDNLKKHNGTIFVNGSNHNIFPKSEGANRIVYGVDGSSLNASVESANPFLKVKFSNGYSAQTNLIGAYNLENVMAAACVGSHFGVDMPTVVSALENYKPSNNRSQFISTPSNKLIVDAYNANPTSMKAALDNFISLKSGSEKALILGDMLELGKDSEAEHGKIVEMIAASGIKKVMLVGQNFASVAKNGMSTFKNADELITVLTDNKLNGCLILIKGSNSMKLTKVVEYL
ncbi:MAG: UDP-N-acetylmuramoyl-tripeptide--D-alanyl-D-alanine ligase [Paludibacteraceae bacterium]|nr:UDP-N-acetylmuramoyl-tripeptide--D-alanyl-D-alanine ligase [Paludibacteraceae bacterium]